MQSTTPTIQPPRSSVGEGSAKIAVAVFTYGEKASVLFCWTFEKALVAGLRRGSVAIVQSLPLFQEMFSVAVITVPASQRAVALASVKETLAELGLLLNATIATDRAGDSWFTVHGLGVGGIKFEEGFLRPEFFDSSITAMREWNNNQHAIINALREDTERRAAAAGVKLKTP